LAAGETLVLSYTVTATDQTDAGLSDSAVVTITITGTNDAPTVNVNSASTLAATEDGATVTGTMLVDDVDTTDTHTFSITAGPAEGSVAVDSQTGTYTFDPEDDFQDLAAGETRDVTFTVQADDGNGGTVEQQITVTVTGVNDAPVSIDFEATLVNGSAPIDFAPPNVTDVEDDSNPSDTPTVTIDSLPKFGTLIDSNGDPITLGQTGVDLNEAIYVADPNLDLSDEVNSGFVLGAKDSGDGQTLDNWGADSNGSRLEDLGGVTVTTSVTPGDLMQYNNNKGDNGHIGNGIADGSGEGLNAGDVLTVDFGGLGVTQANIGLDGMGGHFYSGGSQVQITVTYLDGTEQSFTYTKQNAGDDEFAEVSVGDGALFDTDGQSIGSIGFTTLDSTNSDGAETGSNWELRYVEVPPESIVLSDSFDYTPVDSDGLSGNSSTVTINGLQGFVNDPPVVSEAGPKMAGGLMSEFYLSSNQINNLDEFRQVIADNDPEALFISTGLNYNGSDGGNVGTGSSLEAFLGADADSLTQGADTRSDAGDAGIRVFGDVSLNAGHYVLKVRADDGFDISIDGESVAQYAGNQSPTTRYYEFSVDQGGMQSFEALWWDQGGQYVFDVDIAPVDGPRGIESGTKSSPSGVIFADFAHSDEAPWCFGLVETNAGLVTMGRLDVSDVNTAQAVTVSLSGDEPVVNSGDFDVTGIDFGTMLTFTGGNSQVVLDHTESADTVYYVFDSNGEAFNQLDHGETITVTYGVSATDGAATSHSTITVTITGTNDAPTLTATSRLGPDDLDVPLNVFLSSKGTALFKGAQIETVEQDQFISQIIMTVSGLNDGIEESLLYYQRLDLGQGQTQTFSHGGFKLDAEVVSVIDGVATVIFSEHSDNPFTVAEAQNLIDKICYWHQHNESDATAGLRTIEVTSIGDTAESSTEALASLLGLTSEVWVGKQLVVSGSDNIHEDDGTLGGGDHGGTAADEMIVFSDMTDTAITGDANGISYANNTLLLSGNGGDDLFVAVDRDFGSEDGQIINATIDDFVAVLDDNGQPDGDVLDLSALFSDAETTGEVTQVDGNTVITVKDGSDNPLGEFTLEGVTNLGTDFDALVDENIIKIV